jgi:lipopolysaccharide export system protein LptA
LPLAVIYLNGKKRRSYQLQRTIKIAGAGFFIGWLLLAGTASGAGLFPSGSSGDAEAPIEIVADRLVASNTEKWADFTGSVKATQGKFTMTADSLRIYYEGDLITPSKTKSARESIQKLVASGRVHIVAEQYVADSERAEYVLATDILTLTGANSKVVSGKNILTGSKIVLKRSEGKAEVEGSASERVKALFYQDSTSNGALELKKPQGQKD